MKIFSHIEDITSATTQETSLALNHFSTYTTSIGEERVFCMTLGSISEAINQYAKLN